MYPDGHYEEVIKQVLASVLRAAQQRQLDTHAVLVSLLHAAAPVVPLALAGRAR